MRVHRRPGLAPGRGFVALAGPHLDPTEAAVRQIERLGFRAEDVRHLVPTHLDVEHAGACLTSRPPGFTSTARSTPPR